MDRSALVAEANRLGNIIMEAERRFQRARPRSRGAAKANIRRAEKQYSRHSIRCREAGYLLDGPCTAHFLIEMTEEQKAEFRRWRGEAA